LANQPVEGWLEIKHSLKPPLYQQNTLRGHIDPHKLVEIHFKTHKPHANNWLYTYLWSETYLGARLNEMYSFRFETWT